ncbi:hypothetical protein F4778DRAFT_796496, partial [Xylariomycetidae sp. FL2044]
VPALHLAGEHTTDTHPATVHGAYLSGLQVASEVIDTMLGPIQIPVPLIRPKTLRIPLRIRFYDKPVLYFDNIEINLPIFFRPKARGHIQNYDSHIDVPEACSK